MKHLIIAAVILLFIQLINGYWLCSGMYGPNRKEAVVIYWTVVYAVAVTAIVVVIFKIGDL